MNSVYIFTTLLVVRVASQEESVDKSSALVQTLQKCNRNSSDFDPCIKNVINALRPQYETGFPEFSIPPFDPFFAEKVTTKRGGRTFNMKLSVINVTESGWSKSMVTAFKTNWSGKTVRYHQFFPEKYLNGGWDINTNLVSPFHNEGRFNLSLYNYTQVTTIRWSTKDKPFKVRIDALECGDLKLHITNLVGGRAILENMLDAVINAAWRPGFNMLKPIINDLVSTAFTKIMNDGFKNVPFETIFPE